MKAIVRMTAVIFLLVGLIGTVHAQWPLGGQMPGLKKDAERFPYVTTTGRYQIFVSPHAKKHTFMLDTETGRVWIMKKDHASGDFSWKRVPVDEVDDKEKGKKTSGDSTSGGKKSSADK